MQPARDITPTRLLNVPAGQLAQPNAPLRSWNVPTRQSVHVDEPARLNVPRAHGRHCSASVALVRLPAVPAGQFLHMADTVSSWKVPTGHAVHAREPERLNVPRGQGWHCMSEVSPTRVLKVPSGHSLHELAPSVSWKRPSGQEEHARASSCWLKVPRGHSVHWEMSASPISLLKVPRGHDRHDAAPSRSWKRPAEHGRQRFAPRPLMLPLGHARHCERLVARSSSLKVPAGQRKHESLPRSSWYVPARQLEHSSAPPELKVPSGHAVQAPLPVAPVPLKKVPRGHLWQFDEPVRSWKVPLGHALQVSLLRVLEVPLGHGMHMATLVKPVLSEKVPEGQVWHLVEPRPEANWPVGHMVQRASPSSLKVPGAHSRHAEEESAPDDRLAVPERHVLHDEERVLSWKVPGAQAPHIAAPGGEKVPLGHAVQASTEVAPVDPLAVPAGQRSHEPPLR